MNSRSVPLSLLLTTVLVAGCNRSGGAGAARIAALQNAVRPGMPRSQVEQKLLASGLPYSWDSNQNAFLVIARDVSVKNLVHEDRQLIIHINPQARVSPTEMTRLYTGP
jgi:predicted small secreted protein